MALFVTNSRNEDLHDIVNLGVINGFDRAILAEGANLHQTGLLVQEYEGPVPEAVYISSGDTDMFTRNADGILVPILSTRSAIAGSLAAKMMCCTDSVFQRFGDIPIVFCDHYGINLTIANEGQSTEYQQDYADEVVNVCNDVVYEINDANDCCTPRFSDITTPHLGVVNIRVHVYHNLDEENGYSAGALGLGRLPQILRQAGIDNRNYGYHN